MRHLRQWIQWLRHKTGETIHLTTDPACAHHTVPRAGSRLDRLTRGVACRRCFIDRTYAEMDATWERMRAHAAQGGIVTAPTWRVVGRADGELPHEYFIPLDATNTRAIEIWRETCRRLGIDPDNPGAPKNPA